MYYIDNFTTTADLEEFLRERNWMVNDDEIIEHISIAGEGNMNVVLRILTNERSFILKQSRPYVQKFQDIPAPLGRIGVEYLFYENIVAAGLNNYFPQLKEYDADHYIFLMEDLGETPDMTWSYSERDIKGSTISMLTNILSDLHKMDVPSGFPENLEMRKLNHTHVFHLPFIENNGLDLDGIQDGLGEVAAQFLNNPDLKAEVDKLGSEYLSAGQCILHGDYYPGSWLASPEDEKVNIIDPEFSFVGFPEYDLGVMAAHLYLIHSDEEIINTALFSYHGDFDRAKVHKMAGIEIARRLIGLAQLPLERTVEEKAIYLQHAQKLILGQ